MPVRPVREQTWLPGSNVAIPNVSRLADAFPVLARCAARQPSLTRQVLDPREYSYRAHSLSGGYRLAALLDAGPFDVLHNAPLLLSALTFCSIL
jgi:hypothetical protein